MPKVAHRLIAETAQAIAREAYEAMAHHNEFYKEWPKRETFVRINWRMFVDDARAALLKILGDPNYPEHMKEPIYEAMLIDGSQRKPHTPPSYKIH